MCPLRHSAGFDVFGATELAFLKGFKRRHGSARAGAILLDQGATEPRLFTLFSGWALRTKMLATGERQLLDVLLPGDLVGLSSVYLNISPHQVQALTDVTMCEFDTGRFHELLAIRSFAEHVAHYHQMELRHIEGRLTSVGATDVTSRVAYLLAELLTRLHRLGISDGHSFRLPLRRQHIAEAVGSTRVHVSRVLHRLRQDGVAHVKRGIVTVPDPARLREFGRYEVEPDIVPIL